MYDQMYTTLLMRILDKPQPGELKKPLSMNLSHQNPDKVLPLSQLVQVRLKQLLLRLEEMPRLMQELMEKLKKRQNQLQLLPQKN